MPVGVKRTADLLAGYLAGRTANTLRAYRVDLERFASFANARGGRGELPPMATTAQRERYVVVALHRLLNDNGQAFELCHLWRQEQARGGMAPATINRRLAVIRGFVSYANAAGAVPWRLRVTDVPAELTRDTRGPSVDVIRAMLDEARATPAPRGPRDVAVLLVLFGLGLRASEAAGLDVADVEPSGLWVLGKGRTRKTRLAVPEATEQAITAWLAVRGDTPGPLFTSYHRRQRGRPMRRPRDAGRLSRVSIFKIVRRYGAAVGAHVSPHGLRHAAITAAVEQATAAGLSIDTVTSFSRHRNLSTLLVYRDHAENYQGRIAGMVAGALEDVVTRPALRAVAGGRR